MNVFLTMVAHVASFFALVLVTVACLYALVLVCRKALSAQAELASQARIHAAVRDVCERIVVKLALTGADCYEAELQAIYEASPAVVNPSVSEAVSLKEAD